MTGTVGERSKQFIDQYFDGQESAVFNPATGDDYGQELKIHDALHQYANVGNTLRGEEQLTIAEKVGTSPLAALGLTGLTQQEPSQSGDPSTDVARQERDTFMRARTEGGLNRTLVQQRGVSRGSSLFRDQNAVTSFLSPPLTNQEVFELQARGREFYDQVHSEWARAPKDPEVFIEERSSRVPIEGGYRDTGGFPFGPKEQFMNPPLAPVVEYEPWNTSLDRQLKREAASMDRQARRDIAEYNSPAQRQLRSAASAWDERSRELNSAWNSNGRSIDLFDETGLRNQLERMALYLGAPEIGSNGWIPPEVKDAAVTNVLGPRPKPAELGPMARGLVGLGGLTPEGQGGLEMPSMEWLRQSARNYINHDVRNSIGGGFRAGASRTASLDGEPSMLHLNPPNLGGNVKEERWPGLIPGERAQDILLTAARDAKDSVKVRNAIGTGFNATMDVAGSLPLFDPEFRSAVEGGDVRKAGGQVIKEYAIGAAAAPVVSAAAGVVQRAAPQVAARMLPAVAGANRIGNPVAVVSQLGGSQRQSRAQQAADRRAGQAQLLRAEAARRRGGKWKVGPFTVPELGLSEAGGLFFR